ncbi:hypothetical protein ACYSNR_14020 [Enterococcus sp. LJL128]|uniref:hypothetical protein n=1 Tax=Enterococcus sp. LJL51 TaxID=3416656 RepID=UPI003CF6EFF1
MEIKAEVIISEKKVCIQLPEALGKIVISEKVKKKLVIDEPAVYVLLKDKAVVSIGLAETAVQALTDYNQSILFIPPVWDVEPDYLKQFLLTVAIENGVYSGEELETIKIPVNHEKALRSYVEQISLVLEKFGVSLNKKVEPEKVKAKPAKARHRWTKEVSQIEFTVAFRESKGTVFWQKRNEMLLKAGAILKKEPELNKDGSLGYSGKYGEKLRADYQDKIKNFKTTEDIVLKSVNELGLFLYFGGTNGWLELKDADGKTMNEWTVVE